MSIIFLLFCTATSWALPFDDIAARNAVTTPTNCRPNQQLINGSCRDVWLSYFIPANVVTVPPNCPDGQQWINGACRDVWRNGVDSKDILTFSNYGPNEKRPEISIHEDINYNQVTVPINCPYGQELISGVCRDIWRNLNSEANNMVTVSPYCGNQLWINGKCQDVWINDDAIPSNVVSVPTNCPSGQQLVNGVCRDVWRNSDGETKSMVTVSPNCSPNQQSINGQCQDVWKSDDVSFSNVVTVPTNCPDGQQLVNGVCRDVWKTKSENGEVKNPIDFESALKSGLLKIKNSGYHQERARRQADDEKINNVQEVNNNEKNIISVPNQCPSGYKPDANGICREIFV